MWKVSVSWKFLPSIGSTTRDTTCRDYHVSFDLKDLLICATLTEQKSITGPLKGPVKRTPGRLPRIPFTPHQLNELEQAYKAATYLSTEDANKLAKRLELTGVRVKIWFQNRRARDRRERRDSTSKITEKPSDDDDNDEEIVVS